MSQSTGYLSIVLAASFIGLIVPGSLYAFYRIVSAKVRKAVERPEGSLFERTRIGSDGWNQAKVVEDALPKFTGDLRWNPRYHVLLGLSAVVFLVLLIVAPIVPLFQMESLDRATKIKGLAFLLSTAGLLFLSVGYLVKKRDTDAISVTVRPEVGHK